MRRSHSLILASVVVLLIGVAVALGAQDQKPVNKEERANAINVVRMVNTAELWYNRGTKDASDAHGRYGSWEELNTSGVVKTLQSDPSFKDLQVSPSPEVIPGHRVDLLVSSDGKSYSVALHDTRSGYGLFSVFSDQNGIIFLGSPLQ